MYKLLYKSHKTVFSIDFLWLIWHVPGGGLFWADAGPTSVCWADVGPLAAMFSWLLGTFHDGSL